MSGRVLESKAWLLTVWSADSGWSGKYLLLVHDKQSTELKSNLIETLITFAATFHVISGTNC